MLTAATPRTFEARTLLQPEPPPPLDRPVPVRAFTRLFGGVRLFVVVWNTGIQSYSPGSIGNWFPVWNGFSWLPTAAPGFGATTQVRVLSGIPVGGPDRISYFASPPEVKELVSGNEALPFTDFPIT